MIPKTIHRVWLGGPMPEEFRRFGETWRAHNPGWEVRDWGDEDLTWMENRDLYDRAHELTPERYVPRFRSNLARYEIISRYGGVYVDTDCEALSPIGPHIEGLEAFAAEERPGVVANTVLGGVAGHRFWDKVVKRARASIEKHAGQRSPLSCGPLHLTRCHKRYPGLLTILPTELFYPYHWTEVDRAETVDMSGSVCHHRWSALRGEVSVIVPWVDTECAYRKANWTWLQGRLGSVRTRQIVPSTPDGSVFSRSQSIRNGFSDAFGDVIVVSDADVWCDGLDEAIQRVRAGAAWAVPHTMVHRLNDKASAAVLEGMAPDEAAEVYGYDEDPYRGVMGGGLVVLSRDTLREVMPDPRFEGWGQEDQAWGYALRTMVGAPWRGQAPLWHLWHPPMERVSRAVGTHANYDLKVRYQLACGNQNLMRKLMAEPFETEGVA